MSRKVVPRTLKGELQSQHLTFETYSKLAYRGGSQFYRVNVAISSFFTACSRDLLTTKVYIFFTLILSSVMFIHTITCDKE